MSHLAQFRALEWLLANKKDELQFIKVDPQLRRELEFESKLHDLLAEYQFGLRQVLSIMAPEQRHTFDLFTRQPPALVSPTGFRRGSASFIKTPIPVKSSKPRAPCTRPCASGSGSTAAPKWKAG